MSKSLSVVINLVDHFTKGMNNVTRSSQEMLNAINKVKGVSLAVAGTTAFGLKKTIDAASEFQNNLTPLNTVVTSTMGSVKTSIDAIGKASLDWSSKHKQSTTEFLQASYMMSSAGFNDVQAIEGTRKALALATVTMGDASEAANLVALMYNNFGNKANNAEVEMSRIGDTLAKTQALFQIANLGQLNEGLKYASASALSAKISFNEMNAAVGMLNTVGLQGSMAGTSFAQMTAKMTTASEKLGFEIIKNAQGGIDFTNTLANVKNAMKGIDSITQGNMLRQAFGDEAARGVALLLPKLGDMKKAIKDIEGATGFLAKYQKAVEGDFISQMQIFRNNINNLMVNIGTPFLAVLNPLIQGMTKVMGVFNYLLQTIPGLRPLLAGLAVYVLFAALKMTVFSFILSKVKSGLDIRKEAKFFTSALSSVTKSSGMSVLSLTSLKSVLTSLKTGGLATSIKGLSVSFMGLTKTVFANTAAFLANPITWIVIGIIALVAWIVVLVKKWDLIKNTVKGIFKPVAEEIKRLKQNLLTMLSPFKKMLDSIGAFLKPVTGWIAKAFNFAKITLSFKSMLYYLLFGLGFLTAALMWLASKGIAGFLDGINDYLEVVMGVFRQVIDGVKDIWSGIEKIINGDITGGLLDIGKGLLKIVTAPIIGAVNMMIALINNVIGMINKVSFKVPSWVPKIGGETVGFNVPEVAPIQGIPSFAKGVENFGGGLAYVHQDELISLPKGANVHTKKETREILQGKKENKGNSTIINKFYNIAKVEINGDKINDILRLFEEIERLACS